MAMFAPMFLDCAFSFVLSNSCVLSDFTWSGLPSKIKEFGKSRPLGEKISVVLSVVC